MGKVRDTTGRLYAQWVVSKEVRVGRGDLEEVCTGVHGLFRA